MTTPTINIIRDKVKKNISKKTKPTKAILGRPDGVVKAGGNDVYVTLYNNEVKTVHNERVPLRAHRKVLIGYTEEKPNILQVLGFDPVYLKNPLPEIVNHGLSHEWDQHDWIRVNMLQVMQLLPRVSSSFTVQVFGGEFYCNGAWHYLPHIEVDLSTEVVSDGAEWVNVEVDENNAISFTHGDNVESRDLLVPELIPSVASDKKLLFSAKMYSGQVSILQSSKLNDIYDPRLSGFGSGGASFPTLGPLRVVITDEDGNVLVSDELIFNYQDGAMSIGNPAGTGHGDGSAMHIFAGDKDHAGSVSSAHNIYTFEAGLNRSSRVKLITSKGTKASPIVVDNDTVLGTFRFAGYDGEIRVADATTSAEIIAKAKQTFDSDSHGTEVAIRTTPNDSVDMRDVLVVGENGQIVFVLYGLGTYTGTPTSLLGVNSSGQIIEVSPSSEGSVFFESEIDFGTTPVEEDSFLISFAGITADTIIIPQILMKQPSSGREVDEIRLENLDLKCVPSVNEFVLYARSLWGTVSGDFVIGFTVGEPA